MKSEQIVLDDELTGFVPVLQDDLHQQTVDRNALVTPPEHSEPERDWGAEAAEAELAAWIEAHPPVPLGLQTRDGKPFVSRRGEV